LPLNLFTCPPSPLSIISIPLLRTFTTVEALEAAYLDGSLHPGDLKPALASAINTLIEPVRNHFKTNEDAKKLLATIKKYQQQDAAKKVVAATTEAPQVVA